MNNDNNITICIGEHKMSVATYARWLCLIEALDLIEKNAKEQNIDIKKSNKTAVKKIIVSVKGGKNLNPAMIRDLRGTMETNKAEIGLFVTLTPPSQPMIKEAASSGFYKAGNGRNYAKVQILTIEELLTAQKRPEFFDMKQGELTFKKAQRENRDIGEQGNLFSHS